MTRDELRILLETQLDKIDIVAPFREVYRRLTTPWNKINVGVTIICQGPLRPESARALKHYTKFGPVIYSYWEEDWKDELKYDGVTFLKNPPLPDIGDFQNVGKQIFTTLNALELVKTSWVLKTRTDTMISNIGPFIESMLNNPDKLTTSNAFFRNTPFHCSDIIFGGNRAFLESALVSIRDILYNNKRQITGEMLGVHSWSETMVPENLLTVEWLRAKGVHPDLSRWKDQMKRAFNIVDMEQLGKFEVTINSLNKVFRNGDVFPNSISSLDNL
jgi:hypothetical protein